jgi:glycerol-3-phosphate acyltransferase PlsY
MEVKIAGGYAIAIIIPYLLGSIPFGYIFARLSKMGDIRKTGSGNIGATNALRLGGAKLAVPTLLCDVAKGALAVEIFKQQGYNDHYLALAGTFAVLGHIYPLWLKFRGGKGVATALGVIMAASPLSSIVLIFSWIGMYFYTRIPSLASSVALLITYLVSSLLVNLPMMYMLTFLVVAVLWAHRDNIERLLQNREKPVEIFKRHIKRS